MHVHDRVSSGLNLTRPGVWGQKEAETTRRGYYVSASTLNDSASCFFAQRQLDDGPHLTNRTPHLLVVLFIDDTPLLRLVCILMCVECNVEQMALQYTGVIRRRDHAMCRFILQRIPDI